MSKLRSAPKAKALIPPVIIIVVCFAVYFAALSNGFVYDDDAQVVENFWIRNTSFLPKLFLTDVWKFYGEGASNYYRPVMHLIYMVNYHIFGLSAWGFHLVNILFHAGVSVLVFIIASRLLGRSSLNSISLPWGNGGIKGIFTPPLIAALIFATHPINTEAVVWVAGLPELSFTFFYLLSLYSYMRATDEGSPSATFLSLSAISFFLAALSKETALTLPVILVAYDYAVRGRPARFVNRLMGYVPYLLVAGIYFVMRFNALESFAPLRRHAELNAYQYVINVFPLFSQYLGKLLLPVNLSAFHVLHPIMALLTPRGILSSVVTAVFIAAAFLAARRSRMAFFSLMLIAVPLLPALYIPGLGENSFTERYLYLPCAGFALLIGLGMIKASKETGANGAITAVLCLIISLYSLGTILRIPVWKDNYSLWTDTLPKSPDGAVPHSLMGDVFLSMGQNSRAVEEYQTALRLNPDLVMAHTNLGVAYKNMGLTDKAIQEFRSAIELNPSSAGAHTDLGVVYNDRGMTDEALKELRTAIRLNPYLAGAYMSLGDVYSGKGMIDDAIEQYREALRINPDFGDAHNNLGIAYGRKGMIGEAIRQFEAAVRLMPDDPAYHYNAAKAYQAAGMGAKAGEQLNRAKELEEGKR